MEIQQARNEPVSFNATSAISTPNKVLGRRLLALALNLATVGGLIVAMGTVLATSGWTIPEVGMLIAFAVTLPWLSLGFWNAIIGFTIARFASDPAAYVTPAWRDARRPTPTVVPTALAMAIRNEDPAQAIARLEAMQRDLDGAGVKEWFAFHVLSDSSDPKICEKEKRLVNSWKARAASPSRIHYRRRSQNTGFKAGNIHDFCLRYGDQYDLFIPLDADSLMSAEAILRLVRCMQAHPEIGILQGLVVGAPTVSLFARVFQFGMRHGMRSYTLGSAWWQGDCGPYWGHNAAIRMKPFREHCRVPVIRGKPPLGGPVLSHDQVEAVLMRRAGYEVRVVAEDDESFEENPPSLPDFIKRDLRWCQGNMQYINLLGMPGLHGLGRVQLLLAILMYAGGAGWMLFMLFGLMQAFMPVGSEPYPTTLGLALFVGVVGMSLMPKVVGVLDTMVSDRRRALYGGARAVLTGSFVELLFAAVLAPVASLAVAIFIAGLAFGRRISWDAQHRVGHEVKWSEAATKLWPHVMLGLLTVVILTWQAPGALPWAMPLLVAFFMSIPFAVITSSPRLGRAVRRLGLNRTPEEIRPPSVLIAAGMATARPAPSIEGAPRTLADTVPLPSYESSST